MSQRMLVVGIGLVLSVGLTAYFVLQRPSPVDAPAGNGDAQLASMDTSRTAQTGVKSDEKVDESVLADEPAEATGIEPSAELPEIEPVISTNEQPVAKSVPEAAETPVAKTPPKPLLKDWPAPAAAFVLSGEMHGYVEPCGCSLNQLGGLSRRADLLRQIQERGWPVTALDAGGLVSNAGRRQAKVKLRMALESLKELQYAAIAMGIEEVQTGIDLLLFDEKDRPPLLSCNLVLGGGDIGTHIPKTIATVGKLRVGVTAVFGDSLAAKVAPQNAGQGGQGLELQVNGVEASLNKVLAELEAEKPDLMVLLSHAKLAESKELAKKFPQFHLIVSAGGPEDPDPQPQYVGETLVVAPGQKGKHVAVVGYYPDEAGKKFRYESVALDGERFQEAPSMREQMRRYQEALAVQDLVSSEPRIEDPRNAQLTDANPFVGAKACGECHTRAYKKWQSTGHAKATQSIKTGRAGQEATYISRIHDPECVACHVTGWEPGRENQEGPKDFYGFKSGFVSEQLTALLTGQGCENCHGPGGRHTDLERQFKLDGKETDELTKFRDFHHLKVDGIGARLCVRCHDGDNDPHFKTDGAVFDEFWSKIAHPGVD